MFESNRSAPRSAPVPVARWRTTLGLQVWRHRVRGGRAWGAVATTAIPGTPHGAMMTVTVRPGRMDDLYDLVQFSIGVARESEGRQPDPDTVRDSIAAALQDPHKGRYFVADDDGALVGSLFVTFEWSDWTGGWYWWIQGVYVVPERRGKGVYRAMYDAVHRAAAAEGDVRRIRLYVEKDNAAGLATYRATGMDEAPYVIFDAPVSRQATAEPRA